MARARRRLIEERAVDSPPVRDDAALLAAELPAGGLAIQPAGLAQLHEEAFRYFGGVPSYVVLDNLKKGVLKPDLYEPELNPIYSAMLADYAVVADPARVADPEWKGCVEMRFNIPRAPRWPDGASRRGCQIAANSDPLFASKNDPSDGAETGDAEPHIAEQSRSWRSASGEREVMRGS